jgi:hypothetical protein
VFKPTASDAMSTAAAIPNPFVYGQVLRPFIASSEQGLLLPYLSNALK